MHQIVNDVILIIRLLRRNSNISIDYLYLNQSTTYYLLFQLVLQEFFTSMSIKAIVNCSQR